VEYTLIGYFPKLRLNRESWSQPQGDFPAPSSINRIASVSYCLAKGPTSFDFPEISQASFNQYGGFNRLADARSAIDKSAIEGHNEYDLYAYALPSLIYTDGIAVPLEIGCIEPEEFPDSGVSYVRVGFDVVEMEHCNLGHSPLTCNGQAGLVTDMLNEYCLIAREEDAISLAKRFSIEKPEPGSYTFIEVWLLRDSSAP
jgi:hypothetical protein